MLFPYLQRTGFSSTPKCIAFLCLLLLLKCFMFNAQIFLPGYVILIITFTLNRIYRVSGFAWISVPGLWFEMRYNVLLYNIIYLYVITFGIRRTVFVSHTYPLLLFCFELLKFGCALTYICGTFVVQFCQHMKRIIYVFEWMLSLLFVTQNPLSMICITVPFSKIFYAQVYVCLIVWTTLQTLAAFSIMKISSWYFHDRKCSQC